MVGYTDWNVWHTSTYAKLLFLVERYGIHIKKSVGMVQTISFAYNSFTAGGLTTTVAVKMN